MRNSIPTNFLLDTYFQSLYTFINRNVYSLLIQRENRQHGNQEKGWFEKEERREEEKEVTAATRSGDAKASPEVFVDELRRSRSGAFLFCGGTLRIRGLFRDRQQPGRDVIGLHLVQLSLGDRAEFSEAARGDQHPRFER
jgi:hypothetical protein